MQSKIVFQCTCLISTSRTVGSMFSKLFNVNIGELGFALMNGHWVVEPKKVLILNVGDCGVAHKVMLGNMLDSDRCRESCHLVLGTVDRVCQDGIVDLFLHRSRLVIRSHHLLHHAFKVYVNLTHVLTLNCQAIFSSHSFKHTQLVFCAFHFLVLGNGFTHR